MLFLFFLVFFLISSVLFFFSVASVTESKSLYISRAAGNDAWSCDQWKPCKTISRTIKLATSGDQILLDGTDTDKDPYNCLSGESQYTGIYINESLSLIGSTNPMPQIQCSEGTGFIFNGSDSAEKMNITISGLVLHETFLRIQDSSLNIDGCRFEDSRQGMEIAVSAMTVMNIQITSSTFSRNNNCISVVVNSQSSSSHNTQVIFKLTNSSFDGNVLRDEGKALSFVEMPSNNQSVTSNVDVILENVSFFQNKFNSKGLVWVDTRKASQLIKLQNVTSIDNNPFTDQDFFGGGYSESIVNGSDVTLLINSSNFKSRHARSFSVTAFKISVEVYNSKFDGHRVGSGGVISVRGTNLETFKVYNSIFVNTTADQGGAVSIQCSSVYKVIFKDGTFINNTARNGEGGAVYICSSGSSYKTFQGSTDDSDNVECSFQKESVLQVTVTKCDFFNANSSVGGGGLQIRAARALTRLRNSAFINCSSNPVSFRREGTLVDTNLTSLPKRKAGYDLGEDCRGARKVSGQAGGALSVLVETQVDINIINSSFISNSGGAVSLYSPSTSSTNNNNVIKIKESVFSSNHNSGIAPIDMIFSQNITMILENVTMESNSGGLYGAAAIGCNVTLRIQQSQFLKNRGLVCGAFLVIANKLEVHDSFFDSNCGRTDIPDFWLHGGALLFFTTNNQSTAIKISKTTFKNCSAAMGGAVSFYVKTTANIQIEGSRFVENSLRFTTKNSNAVGGAVMLWSGNDDDSQCIKEEWSRKSYNGKLVRSWDYKRYLLFENTTFEKKYCGCRWRCIFKQWQRNVSKLLLS